MYHGFKIELQHIYESSGVSNYHDPIFILIEGKRYKQSICMFVTNVEEKTSPL